MYTPPRTLRAEIDDIPGARLQLTSRQRERQEVILAAGRRVLVNHGLAGVRLADLATALGMAAGTIRRYFPDLEYLLAEILRTHLLAISTAMGEALRGIAHDAPGRQATARAAYRAATRTVLGGHTEAHLLLVRERHRLPPDLLACIEQTRAGLGEILAGEYAIEALGLLDMPELSAPMIEGMLRVLAPPARQSPRLHIVPRRQGPSTRTEDMTRTPAAWAESARAFAAAPIAMSHQNYAIADP